MAGQPGFFDAEERLRWLSASGDPLEGRIRAFRQHLAKRSLVIGRRGRSRARG